MAEGWILFWTPFLNKSSKPQYAALLWEDGSWRLESLTSTTTGVLVGRFSLACFIFTVKCNFVFLDLLTGENVIIALAVFKVSIVTTLWTGWLKIDFLEGVRNFSLLLNIWIDSGTQPAYHLIHTRGSFSGSRLARAWGWPMISIYWQDYEWVHLYVCSTPVSSWGAYWHLYLYHPIFSNLIDDKCIEIDLKFRKYFILHSKKYMTW